MNQPRYSPVPGQQNIDPDIARAQVRPMVDRPIDFNPVSPTPPEKGSPTPLITPETHPDRFRVNMALAPSPAPPGEPTLVEVGTEVEHVVYDESPEAFEDPDTPAFYPQHPTAAPKVDLEGVVAALGGLENASRLIQLGLLADQQALSSPTPSIAGVSPEVLHRLTLPLNDAAGAKMEEGRAKYGAVWVGMPPLFEGEQECQDLLNYIDCAHAQGDIDQTSALQLENFVVTTQVHLRRAIAARYGVPVNESVTD